MEVVGGRPPPDEVGAEVEAAVDAEGEEAAVLVEGQLATDVDVPAGVVGEVALRAGGDPLHRPAEPHGEPRGDGLGWLRRGALAPEAAADGGRDDPDAVLLEAEGLGEPAPRPVL